MNHTETVPVPSLGILDIVDSLLKTLERRGFEPELLESLRREWITALKPAYEASWSRSHELAFYIVHDTNDAKLLLRLVRLQMALGHPRSITGDFELRG